MAANSGAKALRLVFAFDEAGLHLAGVTHRAKPAPAGADPQQEPADNAVTVEVRTRDGGAVYRQLLAEPIPQSMEVFDDSGPRRIPSAPERGAFAIVVPALDQPADVVVTAGPQIRLAQPAFASATGRSAQRRDLGSFALPRVR